MTAPAARSRARGEPRRAASWVGLVLGLAALTAAGFGLGVVAGVVLEEPSLLFDHAAGRTVSVPLEDGEAEASGAPGAAPAVVEAEPPAAEAPERLRVDAGRSGHGIQVGAFADRGAAEELARSLAETGVSVYLAPGETGAARWRVRVGPFASRAEAERVAEGLAERRLPTWIVSEEGR